MDEESPNPFGDEPVDLPITGELDLHPFRPGDLKSLIPEYLDACREKGILHVRIVHGKGIGNIRRGVHAILERLDFVESFRLAPEQMGGWGATLVWLNSGRPSEP